MGAARVTCPILRKTEKVTNDGISLVNHSPDLLGLISNNLMKVGNVN